MRASWLRLLTLGRYPHPLAAAHLLALGLDTAGGFRATQVPAQEIDGEGNVPEDNCNNGNEVLGNTMIPYGAESWSVELMSPMTNFIMSNTKGMVEEVLGEWQEEREEEEPRPPAEGSGSERNELDDGGDAPEDEGENRGVLKELNYCVHGGLALSRGVRVSRSS